MDELVRLSESETELEQLVKCAGRVIWLRECGSTMDVARAKRVDLPQQGLSLVATDLQNAGRGRQGRGWRSVQGAFQGTFIYPLSTDPLPSATLVVGLAVHEALATFGLEVQLKWPNDIVSFGGRKLGGILTEFLAQPAAYLIGIGVNLLGSNIEIGEARIGSVEAEYDVKLSALQFGAALWPVLERNLAAVQESGFGVFRERWMQAAAFVGDEFSVEQGNEHVVGIFVGVDPTGALLLDLGNEMRSISSGHIFKIRARSRGRN